MADRLKFDIINSMGSTINHIHADHADKALAEYAKKVDMSLTKLRKLGWKAKLSAK